MAEEIIVGKPKSTPNIAVQEIDGKTILAVEIIPGMLDSEITIEKMKSGLSKIRNRGIAAAFSYMNIVEAWGSGIPKMFREAKEYGLREPELIDMGSDFRINLYRKDAAIDQNGVIDPKERDTNDTNDTKVGTNEEAFLRIF